MSVAYRQTISDEMAARIERRRGLLSVQEYTTIALAAALDTPTLCELQQQINELRALLTQSAPAPKPTEDMLSF